MRVPFHKDNVERGFNPVDPGGPYEIECLKCEPGTSKAGKAKLDMEYQILAGPEQADGSDPAGKHLFDHVSAEDDGRAISLANLLDAFGVGDDDGFDTEDLIGATASVITKHEEYEGKIRDKIDQYIFASSAGQDGDDADQDGDDAADPVVESSE